MKKPKKTLKDLGRIEALLAKQTARSAKLLARRKSGDAENPVTSGYYERIAAQQATALADLSEIAHLSETLAAHLAQAEADKAEKKAAKSARPASGKPAASQPAASGKAAAKAPARKAAPKAVARPKAAPAAKAGARRAPRKAPAKSAGG